MRAAVVEAGGLQVGDVADPEPGHGDLVLEVAACGVCGSDLKTYGYMPDGTVMGHEFVGRVVAAGGEVRADWADGTVVTALPVIGCGRCRSCALGDVARCPSADAIGVGGSAGAFAEYVRVSAREAFRFESDRVEDGALVEPLAVGLHAVRRGRLAPGEDVLVIGAGPVGLSVALWARRLGARTVTVSEPSAHRRDAVALFGADRAVDPTTEELGDHYDIVVECVGRPGMLDAALGAVAVGGRIVVAGVCIDPDPFMPVLGVMKEVDVAFVSYYTREEFGSAARLLGSGAFDPGPFVTGRVGLDGIVDTFARLATPGEDRKVLVVPGLAS